MTDVSADFAASKTDAEIAWAYNKVESSVFSSGPYAYPLPPFQDYSSGSTGSVSSASVSSGSVSSCSSLSSVSVSASVPVSVSGSVTSPTINVSVTSPIPNAVPTAPIINAAPLSSGDSCVLASEVSDLADAEVCELAPVHAGTTDDSTEELSDSSDSDIAANLPIKFQQDRSHRWEISDDEQGLSAQELWGLPDDNDTQVIKKLGQGGFGAVYLVEYCNDGVWEEVAMKVMLKTSDNIDSFNREIHTTKKLAHIPHIEDRVALVRFHAESDLALFAFYDFYAGGALYNVIPDLTDFDKIRIFADLLQTLTLIHECDIVHADIKADNILVTERDGRLFPVVADLGLSMDLDIDTVCGRIGTPEFMAPEIYDSEITGCEWGMPADLYALGVTLHELYAGEGWWRVVPEWKAQRMEGSTEEWFGNLDLDARIEPAAAFIETVINACCHPDPFQRPLDSDLLYEVSSMLAYVEFANGSFADSWDDVFAWKKAEEDDCF